MASNGEIVVDLDKRRMQAMAEKDIATLDALLADDLVYTHSTARLDTKQSLIGNMKSGATIYTAVVPSDVSARDLGDAVVLTGVARVKVLSNGKELDYRRLRQAKWALADGYRAVDTPAGLSGTFGRRPHPRSLTISFC